MAYVAEDGFRSQRDLGFNPSITGLAAVSPWTGYLPCLLASIFSSVKWA